MIGALLLLLSSFQRTNTCPLPGDVLKPFVVQTRSGAPYAWKPGRTTVICFCAMWCNTWKDQLPRLAKAENALRGLPVDFLAISVDGRWMDRSASRFANLLADPGGAWTAAIGIDRVPYTLVVDSGGVIRTSSHGVSRSDDVIDNVRLALKPQSGGPIYLTFDGVSDEILDVLRAQSVPATFFCAQGALMGQKEESSSPERALLHRALAEGHSIEELFVEKPSSEELSGHTNSRASSKADERGSGDRGSEDRGSTDRGSTDRGSSDGGSTDRDSTDRGSGDGGSSDRGSSDGGSTDRGSSDRGSSDRDSTDRGSSDGVPRLLKANLWRSVRDPRIRTREGVVLNLPIDDPYDESRPGEKELKRRVLNNARANAVIYLHAGVGDTVAVLAEVIANLKSRGYTFKSLAHTP